MAPQDRELTKPSRRIARERKTLRAMVGIYCSAHHGCGRDLCPACAEFLAYASLRLDKCPFQAKKPQCALCPIHCYRPDRREQAKQVMRYAGPRMLLRHPILAILHMLDRRRKPPERPREKPQAPRAAP